MFEDSIFESAGKIHTRSRRWMLLVTLINSSILLALVLIPLIYPEALPRQFIACQMVAPEAPQPTPEQPKQVIAQRAPQATEMPLGDLVAPRKIPPNILYVNTPEPKLNIDVASMGPDATSVGNDFFGKQPVTIVRPDNNTRMHVASKIEEGLILQKTMPTYPPIAKAAHVEGTVHLAATISKNGRIENLRATGGPAMLQQAALEAVKSWIYRPYLLNDQPVEVETTVDVIFSLSR
jgi:protein TonB